MIQDFVYWALVTLFGLTIGMAAIMWKRIERRQDETDHALSDKVGRQELADLKGYVYSVRDSIHKVEVQLAGIKEQIGRYNSDIESEKRTRKEAMQLLNVKIDRLLERREQDRHRKGDSDD